LVESHRTINIDTGCVFGGNLTALQYPEKELVSVAARETYAQPVKPLAEVPDSAPSRTSRQNHDDLHDIDDVIGKRIVTTRLHHNVTVREENARYLTDE
jgi:protein phosphatase